MPLRVLRILEYIYEDAEQMARDMSHWGIGANGVRNTGYVTIRSATMPFEWMKEEVADVPPDAG